MTRKRTTRTLSAVALSLACSSLITGCGEGTKASDGALIGAGLGAAAGAIIGHQSGHAGEGAAIGAGAGALGGYIVGNEEDKRYAGRYDPNYDY